MKISFALLLTLTFSGFLFAAEKEKRGVFRGMVWPHVVLAAFMCVTSAAR